MSLIKHLRKLRLISATAFMTLMLNGCAGIGAAPEAVVSDMPNEGKLGQTMNKNKGKFEYCARDSVSIQTGSVQNVHLKFQITPEGKATKVSVDDMSDPDPDLQMCLIKAVRSIQFPKPADGETKPVNYPLTLKSE